MKTIQDVFSTGLMDADTLAEKAQNLCHLNFQVALHNPNKHLEVIHSGHPKEITQIVPHLEFDHLVTRARTCCWLSNLKPDNSSKKSST